ncbi:MAG: ABC transporter ATP-binding protein [Thermoleophilaceae bacterium]
MPLVAAHGLVKTFGTGSGARRVLDGAGLEVEAGELVTVLGRSGSGKSTLLNVLGGIDRAESGSIEVRGQRVDRLTERELTRFRRDSVGFVFQFFHLIPELTGEENVLLPARLVGAGSVRRGRELLDRFGLDGAAGRLPHTMSGGEQQRIAIARALVNEAPLVLADEPTGNLDRASGQTVLDDAALDRRQRPGRDPGHPRPGRGRRGRSRADGGERPPGRMSGALREAAARLRARRGRTLVAAAGIAAAAAMVGTAVTLSYGLQTGFDRATERADLPDVVARFQPQTESNVDRRVRGLANVEARSYRFELTKVGLSSAGGSSRKGVLQLVPRGRRGYAVVEGRDLSGRPGELVVERGVAREWGSPSATPSRCAGSAGCGWWASRWAPTTSPFPSPPPPRLRGPGAGPARSSWSAGGRSTSWRSGRTTPPGWTPCWCRPAARASGWRTSAS